jgi:tol-pal system protein YbgF
MRLIQARGCVTAAVLAALAILAPATAGAAASRAELEERVVALERKVDNQGLLEIARQIEALQAELRSLRGGLEELQFGLEGARKQQRDQYVDLDRRLQAAEAAVERLSQAAAPAAGDPVAQYQSAFDLLKQGRYAEARDGFTAFLAAQPKHELAENARYWLGEAHYVDRQFEPALAAFEVVARDFPQGRKLADAMLKAGYCLYELRRDAEAKRWLDRVAREQSGTPAAREAAARLERMKAEGR